MVDHESSSIPVTNISSETSDKRTENDNFSVEQKICEQNLKTLIAQLNLYPKHLTVIGNQFLFSPSFYIVFLIYSISRCFKICPT